MPPKKSSTMFGPIAAAQPINAATSKPKSKPKSKSMALSARASQSPSRRAMMSPSKAAVSRRASAMAGRPPGTGASRMLRDPNYQRRVDIYDELRRKCATDTANCKGTLPDGTAHSYADCERKGATAADLLNNFPTTAEENQRLKALLKAGKDTGEDSKKEWNLGDAKRCLTQLWYGTEEGRMRLEAVAPPKRSSKAKPKSRAAASRAAVAMASKPKSRSVLAMASKKPASMMGFM